MSIPSDHLGYSSEVPWSSWYVDTGGAASWYFPATVVQYYSAFAAEVKYSLDRYYKGVPNNFPIRRATIDYDDKGDDQRLQRLLWLLQEAAACPEELYASPIVLNDQVLTFKEMRALLVRFGASEPVLNAFNRHTWNRRISLENASN